MKNGLASEDYLFLGIVAGIVIALLSIIATKLDRILAAVAQ